MVSSKNYIDAMELLTKYNVPQTHLVNFAKTNQIEIDFENECYTSEFSVLCDTAYGSCQNMNITALDAFNNTYVDYNTTNINTTYPIIIASNLSNYNIPICCRATYSCRYSNIVSNYGNIRCEGDRALFETYLETPYNVSCETFRCCYRANMTLTNDDNYTGGVLRCNGVHACYGSYVNFINGGTVFCDGHTSCREITIRGANYVYLSSSYPLWQGAIYSSSNNGIGNYSNILNVYVLGTHSNGDIYCNKGDTCNIYCMSHISCADMTVHCVGLCLVVCDGYNQTAYDLILCPNIDNKTYNYDFIPSNTQTPSMIPTCVPTTIPTFEPIDLIEVLLTFNKNISLNDTSIINTNSIVNSTIDLIRKYFNVSDVSLSVTSTIKNNSVIINVCIIDVNPNITNIFNYDSTVLNTSQLVDFLNDLVDVIVEGVNADNAQIDVIDFIFDTIFTTDTVSHMTYVINSTYASLTATVGNNQNGDDDGENKFTLIELVIAVIISTVVGILIGYLIGKKKRKKQSSFDNNNSKVDNETQLANIQNSVVNTNTTRNEARKTNLELKPLDSSDIKYVVNTDKQATSGEKEGRNDPNHSVSALANEDMYDAVHTHETAF